MCGIWRLLPSGFPLAPCARKQSCPDIFPRKRVVRGAQMKNMIRSMTFMILVGSAAICSAGSFISVQPSSQTVNVGDGFSLDVGVDITDLYAFQFDLSFNPAVLSATSITEGLFLPTGGSTFFISGDIDN